MSQRVLFTKQPPNSVFVIGITIVELNSFQFSKLLYQGIVDNKFLVAVTSKRFVFMLTNALFQKLRHLEM